MSNAQYFRRSCGLTIGEMHQHQQLFAKLHNLTNVYLDPGSIPLQIITIELNELGLHDPVLVDLTPQPLLAVFHTPYVPLVSDEISTPDLVDEIASQLRS